MHEQAQVGVGIVFQADALGALAVKSLAVGGARNSFHNVFFCAVLVCACFGSFFQHAPGPADKSREIMIGDTLHEIDGVNVFQKPLCMLPLFRSCFFKVVHSHHTHNYY